MEQAFLEQIAREIRQAVADMAAEGRLRREELFVLGCSTSEIAGARIGSASSQAIGDTVIDTLLDALAPYAMTLAVGCCEHLNRSLVVPRAAIRRWGLEEVTVRPALHAGGACGVAYYARLEEPAMVQAVAACAGMDIGHTMIGMHMRAVAVPFRPSVKTVGMAPLVMAYSRPRYVGGPRAEYP